MSGILDVAPAAFPTPWAARAFALVRAASDRGLFALTDFQSALITSIRAHEASGGCIIDEAAYYDCWVEALSALVDLKAHSPAGLAEQEKAIRARTANHGAEDLRAAHFGHAHDHHHHEGHDHSVGSPRVPNPIFVDHRE